MTPGGDPSDRYQRHMQLPGIGAQGQARLAAARVVIVGCGALGSAAAETLARAGVGFLRIIDRDVVEWSNLQRQVLFGEADAREGIPKALAAQRRLAEINSSVEVEPVVTDFRSTNARALIHDADCLVDGLDNFQTRYLLNDLAVRWGLPYIYGGAVATHGACLTILPSERCREPGRPAAWREDEATGCLRCVFPDPPPPGVTPTCETAGVLASAVLTVAAHQVAETIKVLVGHPGAIDRTLFTFDLWCGERRQLRLPGPQRDCPCCGQGLFPFLDGGEGEEATVLCGRSAVQVLPPGWQGVAASSARLDLAALARRLAPLGDFSGGSHILRGRLRDEPGDAGGSVELTVFPDGRAIVHGCSTPERARSLYARYIGG